MSLRSATRARSIVSTGEAPTDDRRNRRPPPATVRQVRTSWIVTLVMLVSLVLVARASARTFYVAPSGNDANPGSLEQPWMSIRRVNGATLKPGDMVRFQG